MDDGAKARSGFYLHTKSFSVAEVGGAPIVNDWELLCKALKQRFNIDTTIQIHDKYPVIYIKAESMEKFRDHICIRHYYIN